MSKKNITKQKHNIPWFYLFLAGFILIGAILAHSWYRFQINPDATSYVSIAEKYARFDFRHAINGYWGPLLSWLLVPFIWLHINPLFGGKFITILAAAAIIFLTKHLGEEELSFDKTLSLYLVAGLSPTLIYWAVTSSITPDLLFVAVLLLEFVFLLRVINKESLVNIISVGILGALLYYTKSIGFYLFLGQIFVIYGYLTYLNHSYANNLKTVAKILGIFAFCVVPMILALSFKYHSPTISTTGTYNHDTRSPNNHGTVVHPMNENGPLPPPNDSAISAWEDPGVIPTKHWGVTDSLANLKFFIVMTFNNLSAARDAIISLGPFVAIGFLVLVLRACEDIRSKRIGFMSLCGATVLLLLAGYSLVIVEPRYIWTIVPLAALATLSFYDQRLRSESSALPFIFICILLSFWINTEGIYRARHIDMNYYVSSQELGSLLPTGANIVSDDFYSSIFGCYYLKLHCYGLIFPSGQSKDDTRLFDEIHRQGIGFYVDFGTLNKSSATSNFIHENSSVYASTNGITVYKFN